MFFWKKEYCDDEYRREGDLKKVNSTLTSWALSHKDLES